MNKKYNIAITMLILLAFAICVVGVLFVIQFQRYILLILGLLFLLTTLALNFQYEKKCKSITRADINPLALPPKMKSKIAKFKTSFIGIYNSEGKLLAEDMPLPQNDFFLNKGLPEGKYFYRTIGTKNGHDWYILSSLTIEYIYAQPLKISIE